MIVFFRLGYLGCEIWLAMITAEEDSVWGHKNLPKFQDII